MEKEVKVKHERRFSALRSLSVFEMRSIIGMLTSMTALAVMTYVIIYLLHKDIEDGKPLSDVEFTILGATLEWLRREGSNISGFLFGSSQTANNKDATIAAISTRQNQQQQQQQQQQPSTTFTQTKTTVGGGGKQPPPPQP